MSVKVSAENGVRFEKEIFFALVKEEEKELQTIVRWGRVEGLTLFYFKTVGLFETVYEFEADQTKGHKKPRIKRVKIF